ncbi:uncharacterized membrane protein YhaH (DUF805 family) [Allocatelliglobosispora scoriae]|uniref:Uncharacterized membrane protein YhaH (DUF805 family) n=1 Tax=Allocatelliglobosispora scoriae TaxID=643052 RepID=A0A841BIF0_9ACTN|nr:hypothetical protein [Allocatelliglobosispora scoriae]MBB5868044.1 uncharacterized membrane protein YhaH (DUF805 family) [Allocatelliglobosispora scoriae]
MLRLVRIHPPLIVTALIMAALALVSTVGLIADDRILLGAPIWLKPLKFAISLAIYSVTFAWLISLIDRAPRLRWWLGTVIASSSLIEMAVIVGQVVRGRRSHFNYDTALDATLFSVMGATIVVLWLATAAVAILLWRRRLDDRATTLAVRFGLVIALAGLGVGFLMTSPTADQIDGMATAPPTTIGAHAVGVEDGGPGLPLLGWSTVGGDLRIGHFIGMHALQALPLLGLALALLARRFRRLQDPVVRARLIVAASVGYAGVTLLVTWQALRGQSLIHPDAQTWAAAGVLAAVTVLAAAAAWRPAAVTLSDREVTA